MKKIKQAEFKGNILITSSQGEVRLWVCNEKGENIFRFRALGKVHENADGVVVIGALNSILTPEV